MYLARWQQLLDDTLIGPAGAKPPPSSSGDAGLMRTGKDVKGVLARGKTGSGGSTKAASDSGGTVSLDVGLLANTGEGKVEGGEELRAVDVGCVVEALGKGFKELVRGLVKGRDTSRG